MFALHYTSMSKMRKLVTVLQGTTLPSAGRVAAERPGWFIYRCKAQMRLTAKRSPGQMTISVSGRLSPGRAPQRGERVHRFEESTLSLFPTPPLCRLRRQLPPGGARPSGGPPAGENLPALSIQVENDWKVKQENSGEGEFLGQVLRC